ncbi:MAG: 2-succinyl-5-enolpyruvyl-6-hydroxy-3-cyclohexene-1-carboxylic-acid synthase [Flammeovirgaceae bacterium]
MFPVQIARLVSICHQKGIKKVVVSPGSRSAPLTIGFVRHGGFEVFTISDERSAAYIALGMAQSSCQTVALVCTSGTAVLNHAPAIAEAFYLQIPLLILSADRPFEWIDQLDGQTIRQKNIHHLHTKGNFEIPSDSSHPDSIWLVDRTVNEAINLSNSQPFAPVHINIPIREPFYPKQNEIIDFEPIVPFEIKIFEEEKSNTFFSYQKWNQLENEWNKFDKKLIVVGQNWANEPWKTFLGKLQIPVVADVIANYQALNAITHQDLFSLDESLKPDLLITTGLSLISKNLKLFLRKHKPKAHWHIQESGYVADTFQSLTKILRINPNYFFEEVEKRRISCNPLYMGEWLKQERKIKTSLSEWSKNFPFGELFVIQHLLKSLPENSNLHLANSMAVRYVNLLGLPENAKFTIFSNRGTSGIDGSSSTSVGHCLSNPQKINILITGDMAFFYDRNAFWHNYPLSNLKILLLNNHAGVIFRMIDAGQQPELEEYFETHQTLEAEKTVQDFAMKYWKVKNENEFLEAFEEWLEEKNAPCLLELITDKKESMKIYLDLKKFVMG